jgi:hypothetical protein
MTQAVTQIQKIFLKHCQRYFGLLHIVPMLCKRLSNYVTATRTLQKVSPELRHHFRLINTQNRC